MATTTTTTTPARPGTGDRNEVSATGGNRVLIGAIIAILAIAALAFALGVFGGTDTDEAATDATVYESTVDDTNTAGTVTTAPADETSY